MTSQGPKKLLILDLDETLIHATELALGREPDFLLGPYFVYQRPKLEEFLEFAFARFRVAVWTSSSKLYGESIVSKIMPRASLQFLWTRERCTRRMSHELQEHHWVKDLKKVHRAFDVSLKKTIMVDDSPEKLERQYSNLVQVEPFLGSRNDEELSYLMIYLEWLDSHENIRPIEKRQWKARYRKSSDDAG